MTVISQPGTIPTRDRLRTLIKQGRWLRPPPQTPYLQDPSIQHVILDRRRPPTNRDVPDGDVVIATWWETAEWVASLSESKGRKYYLLQDYELFPYLPHERVIDTFHLPLRQIAVSRYIRNRISSAHGIEGIEVVTNGVDLDHFESLARNKSDPLTIGFLYQTEVRKNTGLALKVINKARGHHPELRVIAFGADQPTPDLPLPDGVEFHLRPDQTLIPQLYASCDAWLFTSREEGFGLPLLEAMASRTPVIATAAGAAPDLIDGRNGFIVEPNPDAFMCRIEQLARMSDEQWRHFSDHAYLTAQGHTWNKSTDRLEQLLMEG